MITEKEFEFAANALTEAETMLGLVMLETTQNDAAPSHKAKLMAQVLVAAGLMTKLEKSRGLPEGYGATFDALVAQLREQWAVMRAGGDIDLTHIVFPDGPDDYINIAEREETVQ